MDSNFTEAMARIAFAAIWIPFAAMRLHYHRKAEAHTKGFTSQDEGRLIAALRVLVGLPWFLTLFLWLLYPAPLRFASFEIEAGWRMIGIACFLVGSLLTFWTNYTLGRNFSGSLVLQDDHVLIEEGPYALVRHPMYTAYIVMCVGMLLSSANALVGLPPLLGVLAMMVFRTPREERMMLRRFGDDYRSYMERTGKFLPRLSTRSN